MEHLRVATWNVWWRFGPWEDRQPLIADELARVEPDIVGLQESWAEVGDREAAAPGAALVDGPDAPGRSQAAELADRLGFADYRFAWRYAYQGVAGGNAILSRWPIVEADAAPLPEAGAPPEYRTMLRVVVDTPAGPLPFVTTHLNFRWEHSHVRQAQVEALYDFLAGRPAAAFPPVLTGDLNAAPDSDEVRTLTGRRPQPVEGIGFFDAWEVAGEGDGMTWCRENSHAYSRRSEPDRRIDYVMVGYPTNHHGAPLRAERIGTEATDGMHPSDHFGVVTDLSV